MTTQTERLAKRHRRHAPHEPEQYHQPGDRITDIFEIHPGVWRRYVGTVTESDSLIFAVLWDGDTGVGRYAHAHEPDTLRAATATDRRDRLAAADELRRQAQQHPHWPELIRRDLLSRARELTDRVATWREANPPEETPRGALQHEPPPVRIPRRPARPHLDRPAVRARLRLGRGGVHGRRHPRRRRRVLRLPRPEAAMSAPSERGVSGKVSDLDHEPTTGELGIADGPSDEYRSGPDLPDCRSCGHNAYAHDHQAGHCMENECPCGAFVGRSPS